MMSGYKDAVANYRQRRYERLMQRVSRFDASQRLAYGLARKYGINTKGMSPGEVWAAIKDKTGKEAKDFYGSSGNAGADKIRFGTASPKSFTKALNRAKQNVDPKKQWRVTGMDKSELKEWHPNAKLHVTDGGSTIAVDDGDIVAVCANKGDSLRGKDLLEFAVKNGGTKLDSYEGNHGFYLNCGFEPVSWCKWDEKYAPPGWKESGSKAEDVIFYKYTGNKQKMTPEQSEEHLRKFKKKVQAANDYDAAYEQRDGEIK